jgi:hypothetical protein
VRAWVILSGLGALSAIAAGGCTALVSFDTLNLPCDGGSCLDATRADVRSDAGMDAEPDTPQIPGDGGETEAAPPVDADSCAAKPDGGTCGVADSCNNPPICMGGLCTPQPMPDGTVCGTPKNTDCWSYPMCKGGKCGASTEYADGYQWPSAPDDNSRCCGGEPVETTSTTNCGVCGIACKGSEKCTSIGGYYFCTGCGTSNAECWSDCCSQTDSSNGHCTPSTCLGDACKSPDICPKPSHCVAAVPLVFCTYD